LKYFIFLALVLNLYAFNGTKYYKNGDYDKAQKAFEEYVKETNSTVAKAYLAKIYYKEGEYSKASKYIDEVLKSEIPQKVRKELEKYRSLIKGEFTYNIELSAGLLIDSNVKYAKKSEKKETDLAHIEEALVKVSYLKTDYLFNAEAKVQNRGYVQNSEESYVYVNAKADATYHAFINSKLSLGFETKTLGSNNLYSAELYEYKRFGNYNAGIFALGEYYTNEGFESTNLGGGLRVAFDTDDFKTDISLYSYQSNSENDDLDNTNYKADFKGYWHFSEVYLYVNYYYNVSEFDKYRVNMHYLDVSFNKRESKHIFYSMGFTNYYSLSNDTDEELRKYEIYAKFIYSF